MQFRYDERSVGSAPSEEKGIKDFFFFYPGFLWEFQLLHSKSLSKGVGTLPFPRILLSLNII